MIGDFARLCAGSSDFLIRSCRACGYGIFLQVSFVLEYGVQLWISPNHVSFSPQGTTYLQHSLLMVPLELALFAMELLELNVDFLEFACRGDSSSSWCCLHVWTISFFYFCEESFVYPKTVPHVFPCVKLGKSPRSLWQSMIKSGSECVLVLLGYDVSEGSTCKRHSNVQVSERARRES